MQVFYAGDLCGCFMWVFYVGIVLMVVVLICSSLEFVVFEV